MAKFEGTPKEFHDYIGPRIRNKVNTITKKIRDSRNGICEMCSEKHELQSAHIHGNGRKDIIDKVLSGYIKDRALIITSLQKIEKEIIDAHYPLEENFRFLCSKCHKKYDEPQRVLSKKVRAAKENVKKLNVDSDFKKMYKIEGWSKKTQQINHRIISTYLDLLKNNGSVAISTLKSECSIFAKNFDTNFNSMKTDRGNSHGKVFYEDGGNIFIYPRVMKEIKKYWK